MPAAADTASTAPPAIKAYCSVLLTAGFCDAPVYKAPSLFPFSTAYTAGIVHLRRLIVSLLRKADIFRPAQIH